MAKKPKAKRTTRRKNAAPEPPILRIVTTAESEGAGKKSSGKKTAGKKKKAVVKKTTRKAGAKKATPKKATRKAAAKKAAPKKSIRKAAGKKAAPKKAAGKKAAPKKAAGKKAAPKKAARKKAAPKKAARKKASPKKSAAKKSTRKTAAKKAPAKKKSARKTAAKKSPLKKKSARKTTAKKSPTKKPGKITAKKAAVKKGARKSAGKKGTRKAAPTKKVAAKKSAAKKVIVRPLTLLVGTRKGAFLLRSDNKRAKWKISKPIFLGHIVYHLVADPRDKRVVVMAAKTGHLGPTVFRSTDSGKTWKESSQPPAFPKVPEGEKGRAVDSVFWLSPGHGTEPGVWYAGTAPPGLFRSEDNGETWHPINGFNDHEDYDKWIASGGATPGGHLLHSVIIDPRDSKHMYLAISVAGVFESNDGGGEWKPLNRGCAADWLPDTNTEFGHDPHNVVISTIRPDRLYQQNHCGIYRIDRPSNEWIRIGDNMPRDVGDIGFPICVHPRNPDCIWVFPMDGTTVWPRTSPEGKPATYNSRDGGRSWKRQSKGFPKGDAYFTVKRQAMTLDSKNPVGLYIGTTGGEVWGSDDEGENWTCLVRYLPEIYSLTVLED